MKKFAVLFIFLCIVGTSFANTSMIYTSNPAKDRTFHVFVNAGTFIPDSSVDMEVEGYSAKLKNGLNLEAGVQYFFSDHFGIEISGKRAFFKTENVEGAGAEYQHEFLVYTGAVNALIRMPLNYIDIYVGGGASYNYNQMKSKHHSELGKTSYKTDGGAFGWQMKAGIRGYITSYLTAGGELSYYYNKQSMKVEYSVDDADLNLSGSAVSFTLGLSF